MQQDLQSKKNVYFISGGGTGGHIYPAVSVLTGLLDEPDTGGIYYIGNPKNLEFEIISKISKVTFLPVNIGAMPRKVSWKFIKWLFSLEISIWKAMYYIFKYKPDAIFTTGGYVSAPIAFAAILLKKPFMMHDCDAHPGLVSRYIAPYADIVSVAFEKSKEFLDSKKIFVNGNPVRNSFNEYTKESARQTLGLDDKLTIIAMGGSQGAQTINNAIIDLVPTLVKEKNIQLIMQTGIKNYDETVKRLENLYPDYKNLKNFILKPYFDEMAIPIKASDIVISRSGSLSLSEITVCGLPSILIPYPYAAADHQRINAKEMCDKGACIYLEDDECNRDNLLKTIDSLVQDETKMAKMSQKTEELAKHNAVENIINQLKSIIK